MQISKPETVSLAKIKWFVEFGFDLNATAKNKKKTQRALFKCIRHTNGFINFNECSIFASHFRFYVRCKLKTCEFESLFCSFKVFVIRVIFKLVVRSIENHRWHDASWYISFIQIFFQHDFHFENVPNFGKYSKATISMQERGGNSIVMRPVCEANGLATGQVS